MFWAEHSWQTESRVGVDLQTGLLYNVNKTAHSPVYFDFDSHLDSIQPYAEYVWQPSDPLKVRFGVRYRDVKRDFAASVVQNYLPGPPGTVSHWVRSTLPSIDATYRVAENTNVLAQISKGSLVPSQAFFYTANPATGNQTDAETRSPTRLASSTNPPCMESVSMLTTLNSTITSRPSWRTATPCTSIPVTCSIRVLRLKDMSCWAPELPPSRTQA